MEQIRKPKLFALLMAITAVLVAWQVLKPVPSEMEYRQLAQQLAQKQNWQDLEALSIRWMTHHPESGMSHAANADSHRMRGNYSRASEEYAKSLEREADNPQLLAFHGIMLIEMGAYAKSTESCVKSTQLARDHPAAWYCLAIAYAETGNNSEALSSLRTLSAIDPKVSEIAASIIKKHTCKKPHLGLGRDLCN